MTVSELKHLLKVRCAPRRHAQTAANVTGSCGEAGGRLPPQAALRCLLRLPLLLLTAMRRFGPAAVLQKRGVECQDCLEKGDLVAALTEGANSTAASCSVCCEDYMPGPPSALSCIAPLKQAATSASPLLL